MKNLLAYVSFCLLTYSSFAQQYVPFYGSVVDQVSSTNILNNLTEFENLGVKRRGTTALQNTLDWLKRNI